MEIQVTQDHLDRGKRQELSGCALGLALQDAGFVNPKVSSVVLVELQDGRRLGYHCDDSVRRFLDGFDRLGGGAAAPGPGRLILDAGTPQGQAIASFIPDAAAAVLEQVDMDERPLAERLAPDPHNAGDRQRRTQAARFVGAAPGRRRGFIKS